MTRLKMPQPGDIVRCKFPFMEDRNLFKYRHALVLFVSESRMLDQRGAVVVAYGTSQKTDNIYPDEVLLDQKSPAFGVTGLKKTTKFNMSRIETMVLSDENFLIAPNGQVSVGVLHPSMVDQVAQAWSRRRAPVAGMGQTAPKKTENKDGDTERRPGRMR